ncbi:MAG: hypothetical protein ACKO26_04810, partial [Planctomycetota bacterium]
MAAPRGTEPAAPGLMSFTKAVVAPSVFHNSRPLALSSAMNHSAPPPQSRPSGDEPAAPWNRSRTSAEPVGVPSDLHNSAPEVPL